MGLHVHLAYQSVDTKGQWCLRKERNLTSGVAKTHQEAELQNRTECLFLPYHTADSCFIIVALDGSERHLEELNGIDEWLKERTNDAVLWRSLRFLPTTKWHSSYLMPEINLYKLQFIFNESLKLSNYNLVTSCIFLGAITQSFHH